jgi:ParB family chromosome partitioning protein
MAKFGTNILSKTGDIKPRERNEDDVDVVKMKTAPARFIDTQHKAFNLEKENQVLKNRMVSISELTIVEGRKRYLSEKEFSELRANLASFPLINPITIRALSTGGFELIAGHNRVQAYIELNRTEIDANIITLEDEQVLPAAFYSNLLSPELPDYEKYLGFKQIQQATGKSQVDLAKESGLSTTMISYLFSFDELSTSAHKILSMNPQAAGATLISKIKGLPFVEEALEKLVSGEISQQQAMSIAKNNGNSAAKPTRSTPLIIKRGKQYYAEISTRGNTAIVKMKDESAIPELVQKIETLIRAEIGNKEG